LEEDVMDYDLMRIKKGFFIALVANYLVTSSLSILLLIPNSIELININSFTGYAVVVIILSSTNIIAYGIYFLVRRYERFKNVNLHSIHLPIITTITMLFTIAGIIYIRFNLNLEFFENLTSSENKLLLIVYLILSKNLFIFISVLVLYIKIRKLELGKTNSLTKVMFVFSSFNIAAIIFSSTIFLLPYILDTSLDNIRVVAIMLIIVSYFTVILSVSAIFYIYYYFFNFKTEELIGTVENTENEYGKLRFKNLKKYSLIAMFIVLLATVFVTNNLISYLANIIGLSNIQESSLLREIQFKYSIMTIANPILIFGLIIYFFLKVYYEEKKYYINLKPLLITIIIYGSWSLFTIVAMLVGTETLNEMALFSTPVIMLIPDFVLLGGVVFTLFQTKFFETRFFGNNIAKAMGVYIIIIVLKTFSIVTNFINMMNFGYSQFNEVRQIINIFNFNSGYTLSIFIGILLLLTKPVFPQKSIDDIIENS